MRVKRKRAGRLIIPALLIIALLSGLGWYYYPKLASARIKFAVSSMGVIKHETRVKAVFANQEFLLKAPVSGRVEYIGQEGERFRRGDIVVRIYPEGAATGVNPGTGARGIGAPSGGLYFKQTDSLESLYTAQNFASMDMEKLLSQNGTEHVAGASVQAGDPVGKIVNNLVPTVAFIELPSLEGITEGKTLKFTIGDTALSGKVTRKTEKPRGVVVQFTQFIDSSVLKRQQEIIWNFRPSTSGVILPKSALWIKGEEQGVYVVEEGVIRFSKVKVKDEDDQNICVDNIPSGVSVVTNPREGIEGLLAE